MIFPRDSGEYLVPQIHFNIYIYIYIPRFPASFNSHSNINVAYEVENRRKLQGTRDMLPLIMSDPIIKLFDLQFDLHFFLQTTTVIV